MNINLICFFIENLSENDIKNFFEKEKIIVNETEFNYLYKTMKTKYKEILNNNTEIIDEIKKNINKDAFDKLYNLYLRNKKKQKYLF